MNKADLINELKDIEEEEFELKRKLIRQDGKLLFTGFDWIEEGLKERYFDDVYVDRKLKIKVSTSAEMLGIQCGTVRFLSPVYAYNKNVHMLYMKDIRNASGKNVDVIQNIILDRIIYDSKRYGIPTFSSEGGKSHDIIRALIRLDKDKQEILHALSQNNELIRFTKKALEEQLIENSLEKEEVSRGLDVKYYSHIKNMAVTYRVECPFMCKARLASQRQMDNVFVDDYDIIETSFASICSGCGDAKEKVFKAVIGLFNDAYWNKNNPLVQEYDEDDLGL